MKVEHVCLHTDSTILNLLDSQRQSYPQNIYITDSYLLDSAAAVGHVELVCSADASEPSPHSVDTVSGIASDMSAVSASICASSSLCAID